jgi:hypothetical protein
VIFIFSQALAAGAVAGFAKRADSPVAQAHLIPADETSRHEAGRAPSTCGNLVPLRTPLMAIWHDENLALRQSFGGADFQDWACMGSRRSSEQGDKKQKPRGSRLHNGLNLHEILSRKGQD